MSKARDLADFVSANSTLDNLQTTYVDTAGDTMTGLLTLSGGPTASLHAATKQYVDTIASAGIHYHDPVRVESPVNLNATYDNGTAGVGATLTNAGTLAAITIDGVALVQDDRVLVYAQTNATHNGIYTVTTVGDGSTAWVLTRATDADAYGTSDPASLGEGDAFFVKEGDTGAGELYVMNTEGTITFGTTNITFSVIAETAVYSAGTGMTLDGTTFSIGQDVGTTDDVTFNNVTVTGTVDGRDIATNIPASLGTAGQILSVNEGETAAEWADASGGGGSFTATAYEALTAGDPVYMRGDGTVAKTFAHSITDSGVNASSDGIWNSRVIWDSNGSRFLYVTSDGNLSNNYYVQAFTVSDGTVTAGSNTLLYSNSENSYNFVEGMVDVGDGIVIIYRANQSVRVSKVEGTGTSISVGSSVLVETSDYGSIKCAYAVNSAKDKVFVAAQDSSTDDVFAYVISVNGLTLSKGSGIDTNLTAVSGMLYDDDTNILAVLGPNSANSATINITYQPYSVSGTSLTYVGTGTYHEYIEYSTYGSGIRGYNLMWGNFVEIDGVKYALKYNNGSSGNPTDVELVGYINGATDSFGYEPFLVSRTPLGINRLALALNASAQKNFSSELVYNPYSKQLTVALINEGNADSTVAYVVLDMTNAHSPVPVKNQAFNDSDDFRASCVAINPNVSNKDNLIIKGTDVYTWDIPTDVRCIGIAQNSAAASESTNVVITGGVSSVHSGLTAGKPYFAKGNTVSENSGGKQVGYAISATEIVATGA